MLHFFLHCRSIEILIFIQYLYKLILAELLPWLRRRTLHLAALHFLIPRLQVGCHWLIYFIVDRWFWLFWWLVKKVSFWGISLPECQLADIRIRQFLRLITDKFLGSLNHMAFSLLLFLLFQLSLLQQLFSLLLIVLLLWLRNVVPQRTEHLRVDLLLGVLLNEVGVVLLLKKRGGLLYLLLGDWLQRRSFLEDLGLLVCILEHLIYLVGV